MKGIYKKEDQEEKGVLMEPKQLAASVLSDWPHYLIFVLMYWLVPFVISDTGSAIFVLLIIFPFITFVLACLRGAQKGLSFIYPLLVALIFLSTVFVHYNDSALIYVVIYAVIALIGDIIGTVIRRLGKTAS